MISLGVITTLPAPSAAPGATLSARKCLVQLQPNESIVDVRVSALGQGLGRGAFFPYAIGDEVLVAFPEGNYHAGVIVCGLGNAKSANPIGNTGFRALLQHPSGVVLSSADGAPENGIVHGQLLVELAAYITALEIMVNALLTVTSPATASGVGAAAVTFQSAVGGPVSTFAQGLTASASSGVAPGVGGAPFASALHRVSP